jgi:hypothetical protein
MFGLRANFPVRTTGMRASLVVLAFMLFAIVLVSPAFAATFNPNLVISDDNMRADDSLTAADIQAFLVMKNSILATKSFPRHDGGKSASAAVIIYEAARAWRISPKVLLVMLNKEQGLIGPSEDNLAYRLDWAVGMGVPDGAAKNYRFKGFGNQLYWAANRLSGYGEDGVIVGKFLKSGQRYYLNSAHTKWVSPANLATYKLYVYNPSIGTSPPWPSQDTELDYSGNAHFWHLYWSYFGDPFANPAVRPVYSFQDRKNGSFIYTISPSEKYKLSRASKSFTYRGAMTSVNTSGGVNPTPVYKFLNKKTRVYTYTISERIKKQRLAQHKTYSYRGVAFTASTNGSGRPVYRFASKKNGADVLVASESAKRTYRNKTNSKKYRYKGIAFYVMP